jgi:hypothetical protein
MFQQGFLPNLLLCRSHIKKLLFGLGAPQSVCSYTAALSSYNIKRFGLILFMAVFAALFVRLYLLAFLFHLVLPLLLSLSVRDALFLLIDVPVIL